MAVYHFVSHTHWDREWYLGFEQFRMKLVCMIDELLDLLERDARFASFTLDGQTVLLEDYLEVRPEHESRIRSLVQAGRISIGPWYVLPDEFLVSGEALVRNLAIGMNVARRFGAPLPVGYVPDSFGHTAMLPAILNGFGIASAVVYRGLGGRPEESVSEYRWSSPDGSEVLLVHLHRDGYSAGYFHDCNDDEEILARFNALRARVDDRAQTRHRLVLNGGDHHFVDARLPDVLERLRRLTGERIVHGDLRRCIGAVTRDARSIALPRLEGELRSGYNYAYVINNGVYSSRMYLKQANARCQTLLERYLEPSHAMAVARGMTPMHDHITHLWKLLLKNHPHDSICGCSIDAVHREMMTRFEGVETACRELLDRCWQFLVPEDDGAYGGTRSLAVFNPTPRRRNGVCETDIHFFLHDIVVGLSSGTTPRKAARRVDRFDILDRDGRSVPFQVVARKEEPAIAYTDRGYPHQYHADIVTVLMELHEAPAMGWTGYRIVERSTPPPVSARVTAGEGWIENEHLRVEVGIDGTIACIEKQTGQRVEGLHLLEDGGDAGDEYTYSYPRTDTVITSAAGRAETRVLEHGPLRGAIRIRYSLKVPRALSRDRQRRSKAATTLRAETVVMLSAGSRLIEFRTTVVNTARDHRLRVLFPTDIRARRSHADAAFCVVSRRHEKADPSRYIYELPPTVAPMHRFAAVRDARRAFVLYAEGLPEYDLAPDGSGVMALTLLRCVGTLAGDGLITRPGGKAGWHNETPEAQCLGTHRFHYAIALFRAAEFDAMDAVNRGAEEFHAPFHAIRRATPDAARDRASFLEYSTDAVVHSVLKAGERPGSIIARFWNPRAKPMTVALSHEGVDAPVSASTLRETSSRSGDRETACHLETHVLRTVALHLPKHVSSS
jgi:mannosylglycerate hydrolase